MTAIEFLRRYRADDLVKSSARGEFELKSHNSFKINGESSLWHWKSRGIGGKSALDYLMHVEGCSFVEAVKMLCDEQPVFTPQSHANVERQRPPFKLPEKSPTTTRVEAYLRCRGISPQVIQKCIDDGILYESLPYHNCVFVGRDADGVPKYAALRGTYTYGKQFKGESTGSNKRFGFCIEPTAESSAAAVFEAAIDAMAEMTLAGDTADKYRLDPQLVRAVIFQESRFRPDTIGTAGEVGLMQVLPKGAVTDWARRHGVAVPSVRELMRPELNLEIGCYYLSRAMKRWQDYRCRTELALCQYNAGESRANRWKPSQPDGDMIENITIAGTKTYVKNIMRRYQQYRRDEKP